MTQQRIKPASAILSLFLAAFWLFSWAVAASAADRSRVAMFLEVTGFDVALDSIALSAGSAPQMLGLEAQDFGQQWTRMSEQVFDRSKMREQALDILEETLDDKALEHAQAFYASALGQRLVAAENAAHKVEDDEVKQLAGQRIISDLVRAGSDRIALFQRMNAAIDAADAGVRAVQQIQFRFIMAASAAGVIDLQLDADGLRAWQDQQAASLRMNLKASAIATSAYTYQGFSDEEVLSYVRALETPLMQEVYELLNAVQYEITADRYEQLAYRMKELGQSEDI
ncbi:DUF2059 domain-containing protein [Phycobacter azelaicus]|uniref:DUF2059 domain-containing protein n=1 Tax=Phycobacter azelaicus TaxID=2668075 RepID=UPI001867A0E2|nr:DUF2059 domain-containing protein [Phycobacter azelaicus]